MRAKASLGALRLTTKLVTLATVVASILLQ